jgi:UDP-2,3-diacylglucosamine pyrophosphatase LpxH
MSKAIVIISDLHVGAKPLDDFDEEIETHLINFLGEQASRQRTVELVINGDFLDFAQAPPWSGSELESVSPLGIPLCFTQKQSLAKLEAIVEEHIGVFTALGEFLSSKSENTLVINPGNHDVDFFWPKVREVFVDKVCGDNQRIKGQIHFNLEQVYSPDHFPNIWIEHGNQYDPANWFYIDEYDSFDGACTGKNLHWSTQNPPILEDKHKPSEKRLYECLGTRFLIKYLNKLDADYPFVDNIKPFSRFLSVFGASAFASGYGPIKATLAVWGIIQYLSVTALIDPSGFLEKKIIEGDPAASLMSNVLKGMSADQRKAFNEKLRSHGFELDRPLTMYLEDKQLSERLLTFLSDNLDLLDSLPNIEVSYLDSSDSSEMSGYLTLARGYKVDETKELIRAASKILGENKASAVIMGHTHESIYDFTKLRYVNTGSWTRYYHADKKELKSWDILKKDSYKLFPYQLNYAEIIPEDQEPVRLETYSVKT